MDVVILCEWSVSGGWSGSTSLGRVSMAMPPRETEGVVGVVQLNLGLKRTGVNTDLVNEADHKKRGRVR